MNISEVVRRYAVTLLDAAPEAGVAVADTRRDLEGIVATLGASPELGAFLRNRLIESSVKRAALEELFAAGLTTLTMNFMRLLTQQGRESMIPEITQACLQIMDERSGVATAHVRSAVALDEARADGLRRQLVGYFGGEIRLDISVDDSLRGGLVAMVGDTVFDGTVESHLQRLHRKLLGERP